jgi:hypothetical protein
LNCGNGFVFVDLQNICPGGGMAYAGDLKSLVLNGTCGFDSHPGHHEFARNSKSIRGEILHALYLFGHELENVPLAEFTAR